MSDAAPDDDDGVPRCAACELRLEHLPIAARFCPWCGEALPARAAAMLPASPRSQLRERMDKLRAIVREHIGDEDASPDQLALEEIHSLMLLGYANAMLHLGWRYENGSGVARNPAEAVRCYSKSARLGNPYARAWLADKDIIFTPLEHEQPVPAIASDQREEASDTEQPSDPAATSASSQ
jgi:TPR repeat protein